MQHPYGCSEITELELTIPLYVTLKGIQLQQMPRQMFTEHTVCQAQSPLGSSLFSGDSWEAGEGGTCR